jgi:hypothetical protein
MSGPLFSRLFPRATEVLDRRFRWHKLPLPLGLLTLVGLRLRLRERNLFDTSSASPVKVSPPDMYAEPVPEGFGFSDTAFRIFILIASRPLNSDRFFTTDYNANVYTQTGLDWIDDNDILTVLLRHYPELLPSLRNAKNAFAPSQRTAS